MWWERHPRLVYLLSSLFWAALVLGSLAYTLRLYDQQAEQVALTRARVLFDIVETARLWNAQHGGVYAEVSDGTPPNPYLKVPARDILVNGTLFTKVNPAYMTRQLSELVRQRQAVWFNITSNNPIRPQNAPDPWESSVLSRFDRGEQEVLEAVDAPDGHQYRYMRALPVTEPCLQCHEEQGYKIGDVRGGISVTMPAAYILADLEPQRRQTILLHAAAFILLAGLSILFLRNARHNWSALHAAKAEQEALVAHRTRELQDANSALQRSNQDLETFAYVASHDLREPLRMVTSYGSLLKRRAGETLDAEGREYLHYMTDGAHRMQAMIDDLLAYSRVERAPLSRQPIALEDAIALVRHDLGMALAESGATLTVDSGETMLSADPALLHRLLLNLINNALRYGHQPDKAPRITVRAWSEDNGTVLEVADDGPGIPSEATERAFQMFQRLQPRGTDPGGTGMGLAISRRIAERHGGRLWLEPAPTDSQDAMAGPRGARFRCLLPA